jgi:hypothetical protein
MLTVNQWEQIRRAYHIEGQSVREIARVAYPYDRVSPAYRPQDGHHHRATTIPAATDTTGTQVGTIQRAHPGTAGPKQVVRGLK